MSELADPVENVDDYDRVFNWKEILKEKFSPCISCPDGMIVGIGKDRLYVLFLVFVLISSSSVDLVLYTRITKKMKIYSFALSQIIYPVAFCLFVWSVIGCMTLFQRWKLRRRYEDEDDEGEFVKVRKGGRSRRGTVPRRVYVVMALLDTASGMFTVLPIIYLPGPSVVVLGQLGLPILMLMSYFYLDRRYTSTHLLSAIMVLAGVSIVLRPDHFSNGDSSISSSLTWLWILLMVLSMFPTSFSHAYKEKKLKAYDLDGWYTAGWVSLYQLPMSLVIFPLCLIPFASKRMDLFLKNAFVCFSSKNPPPIVSSTRGTNATNGFVTSVNSTVAVLDFTEGVRCEDVWILFMIFMSVNVIFNVVHLLLVKSTTANVGWLTGVAKMGLSDLLFSWHWFAGTAHKTLSFYDVVSAIVVSAAVMTYWSRSVSEKTRGKMSWYTSSRYEPLDDSTESEIEGGNEGEV